MHIHRRGLGNVGETRSAQTSGSGVEGSDGGPAAGVRAAHARGTPDPLRPAVVHRRARHLKSVAVAPAELDGAFDEGIGFDGSAIEGFARASESDMLARPDPAHVPDPAARRRRPADSARMFCDILMPDGSPSWADPRYVLRRALSKAAERGLHVLHPPRDRVLPAEGPPDGRQRAASRSTTAATST